MCCDFSYDADGKPGQRIGVFDDALDLASQVFGFGPSKRPTPADPGADKGKTQKEEIDERN